MAKKASRPIDAAEPLGVTARPGPRSPARTPGLEEREAEAPHQRGESRAHGSLVGPATTPRLRASLDHAGPFGSPVRALGEENAYRLREGQRKNDGSAAAPRPPARCRGAAAR